jgi:hypothetical protein
MTSPKSRIIFRNFSTLIFDIIDDDRALWGIIESGAKNNSKDYTIALPYSSNSNRQYTLIIPGTPYNITFFIEKNGTINKRSIYSDLGEKKIKVSIINNNIIDFD